ncbi:MAG: hypothetical protein IT380_00575 [Myxococcales bacterium]|nr:hypothetical protein [Myxococcales bacterium]
MQNRPDHPTLLDAVAEFLLGEVCPGLEGDKALQFRVLIAANLATIVAGELRTHDARLSAEAGRLKALLARPGATVDQASLDALNRALVERIRTGPADGEAFTQTLDHLLATAKETLAVTNPRFELDD